MFVPRTVRKWHRFMGVLLVLPFLAWAATGFFFFVKPGYEGAYASIQPKLYPIEGRIDMDTRSDWLEIRLVRTVLGDHLLVRTAEGRLHLNPETLAPWPKPDTASIRELVEDAVTIRPGRYGSISAITGDVITMDTGVTVTLNWENLSLYQYGPDTRKIDWMYRIHYLQWTGIRLLDRILGMVGLVLIVLMTTTGIRLLISGIAGRASNKS